MPPFNNSQALVNRVRYISISTAANPLLGQDPFKSLKAVETTLVLANVPK